MATLESSAWPARQNGGRRFHFESPQLLDSYNQRSRQRDRYRRAEGQSYGHRYSRRRRVENRRRSSSPESSVEEVGRVTQTIQPTSYDVKEFPEVPTAVTQQVLSPSNPQNIFTRIYQPNSRHPFILSRQQQSRPSQDSSGDVVSEMPGEDGPAANVTTPPAATTHCVLDSRYLGDASIGVHNAQLVVAPLTPQGTSKRRYPIFRWVHFEDNDVDFRSFQSGVSQISGLTDTQSHGLVEIVDRVRQKFYRPLQTSQSTKARHVMPGMLRETCSPDAESSEFESLSISWSCIPYFCLERYSASSPSSGPFAHPMTTLLQARSAVVPKERDMQQAVCSIPGTPPEHCFHIAQIWSLEVDDDLLVTCAGAPDSTMRGDGIGMIPPPDTQGTDFQCPTLLVSRESSIIWALPIEECLTWFAFTSHFWEHWPERYEFMKNNEVIGPNEWPLILKRAWKSQIRLSIGSSSSETQWGTGILNAYEDTLASNSEGGRAGNSAPSFTSAPSGGNEGVVATGSSRMTVAPTRVEDALRGGLHVLTWPSTADPSTGASSSDPDKRDLEEDLKEMDQFLRWKTSLHQRLAYQRCPERTRLEVYDLVAARGNDIALSDGTDALRREEYEAAVDLVNAAETIFQFFLPTGFEGSTVHKYWGSIYRILESHLSGSVGERTLEQAPPHLSQILSQLKTLHEFILGYTEPLSHAQPSDLSALQIADEFPQSWIYLILLLIDREVLEASPIALLRQGMSKIVQRVFRRRLSEYRVFTSSELASLVRLQLVRDVTHGHLDIKDTYEEYLMLLENDIQTNPLDRTHQDRLARFRQEVSIIVDTLREQEVTLSQQDELIRRESSDNSQLIGQAGTFDSIEQLLVQDSLAIVDERIRSFNGMLEEGSYLETYNIQKIDTNKDRQEAAIYVFTVVTIIFLPLSTVAGILGMNTYDIRNLSLHQWLFWSISIPLSAIVIVVSLVSAGEWGNLLALCRRKLPKFNTSKNSSAANTIMTTDQGQTGAKSSSNGLDSKTNGMSRRRASPSEPQEEV